MELFDGPFEIKCSIIRTDQHPTVFTKVVQERLLDVPIFLSWVGVSSSIRSERDFILPLGGVRCGATTGQKQNTGREYEGSGLLHSITFRYAILTKPLPNSAAVLILSFDNMRRKLFIPCRSSSPPSSPTTPPPSQTSIGQSFRSGTRANPSFSPFPRTSQKSALCRRNPCPAHSSPQFGLIPPNPSKPHARPSFPPFPSVSPRCSGFCSGLNGDSTQFPTTCHNRFLANARPEEDFR